MKKIKIFCWVLIICLIVLVVLQNRPYFWEPQSLGVNLYFSQYNTPELPNGTFVVIALLIGFLVAYFVSLPERFKARKTIKQLSATNAANLETLGALKTEIEKHEQPQVFQPKPDQATEVTVSEPAEKMPEAPAAEAVAPETEADDKVATEEKA